MPKRTHTAQCPLCPFSSRSDNLKRHMVAKRKRFRPDHYRRLQPGPDFRRILRRRRRGLGHAAPQRQPRRVVTPPHS